MRAKWTDDESSEDDLERDLRSPVMGKANGRDEDDDDDEVGEEATNDFMARKAEYLAGKETTFNVLRTMIRRFHFLPGVGARKNILPDNDETVNKVMVEVIRELEVFWTTRKHWRTFKLGMGVGAHATPAAVWAETGLFHVSAYAQRLMDATVGSTDVERMHCLNGRIRTPPRNLLG